MKSKIKRILFHLPKESITKLRYYYVTGKKLNLKEPKDFNQKVLYLMLKEFGEKQTKCSDKYLVREYVKEKGLEDILTKLYYKYNNANEINFEKLPDEYVLKPNHGCGNIFVVTKHNTYSREDIIKSLNNALLKNYAKETLEYQYNNIKPCILCEQYLKEENRETPTDYKISCFNGKAKFILVIADRNTEMKKAYYDLDWQKMDCTIKPQNGNFEKPKNFEKMIEIAEKLSEDFKFVRVDLYNINGNIYFGELTFTPRGGINTTIKQEYLDKWGELIKL